MKGRQLFAWLLSTGNEASPCDSYFVGYQEHLIINSCHGPFPSLIKRYIDDIIGATSLPLKSLRAFIYYANKFYPVLQLAHNVTESRLPFLDIRVTIKYDTISITIYHEERNRCRQLPGLWFFTPKKMQRFNPLFLATPSPSHLHCRRRVRCRSKGDVLLLPTKQPSRDRN